MFTFQSESKIMHKDEINQRLLKVFYEFFKPADSRFINIYTSMQEYPDWDSMTNIDFILHVEQEFELQFELIELEKLDSLNALSEVIEKKIVS